MSVEEEMCTVQVSSAGNEEPSRVTITVNPSNSNSSACSGGGGGNVGTIGAEQQGGIANSALQMVDGVNIMDEASYRTTTLVVTGPNKTVLQTAPHEEYKYEPGAKRQRLEVPTVDSPENLKSLILSINRSLCARLDSIESKMKQLQNFCYDLDGKVNKINATLESKAKTPAKQSGTTRKPKATIVGLPPNSNFVAPPENPPPPCHQQNIVSVSDIVPLFGNQANLDTSSLGSNVTLITLNTEEDFPNGSWLGDPNNIQMRVRCGVSPTDMLHVMETSRTAERCALKLMDYLFDREVQATSNLSGTGKHGKKQLDPLMIYGIRCHLVYKFGIDDDGWHRIKLNMDSKCRTAFRRKQRGLPLKVKAFKARDGSTHLDGDDTEESFIEHHIMEQQIDGVTKLDGDDTEESFIEHHIMEQQIDGVNKVEQQMQRIHVQLQELANGQMTAITAIPTVPVESEHNQVQLADGKHIAISESAQLQIAQMCSQDMPPGTTLVMTQGEVEGSPNEAGSIVMRLSSEGNCLEQVPKTESIQMHQGYPAKQHQQHSTVEQHVQHLQQVLDSHVKNEEEIIMSRDQNQNSTDILVEIQQNDCLEQTEQQQQSESVQIHQEYSEHVAQQQRRDYAVRQAVVHQQGTMADSIEHKEIVTTEDQNSTDILVEIQQSDCV